MQSHPYTFGLEEEYFLVRRNRRRLRHMPRAFFDRCHEALGDRVGSELLQTQVEVQTNVHHDPHEARRDLHHLRRTVGAVAAEHGLAILAAGTHPMGLWRDQRSTDKPHYDRVMEQLQMLGHRNLVCGLHVHVQPADTSARIDLLRRLQPFMPLLLAVSTSSPFWMGHPTGLMGYRQTAYQEIPRTGLPPLFANQAAYDRYVARMVQSGTIEDASFLWWAIRPSLRFPTLELRVPDCCTDADDALALAQLFRCLVRHLEHHPERHAGLDAGVQAIISENLWRAQRHGYDAGLIDLASGRLVPVREMLRNLQQVLEEDIVALAAGEAFEQLWKILQHGTSAHRQLAIYRDRRNAGEGRLDALQAVVDWLADASMPAAET
ncbi:carboxylate-amine ligase [Pseudoxanthomonas sp. PXM04]|uniref:carboxylate-amine ligase n=1 Tax=Pseudoxanthomonas sp. PXM04 TaxID=2769297 RepID=UPI001784FFF2|nr:carboxylate-amine ligase [Pseudoxanthomonas sp. PXM04]